MPDIADATAFFQPGVSEIVFMDAVAATNLVPSASEINAGLNLMNELYDVAGFSQTTNWIERRKGGTRTRTQLAGATSFEGSSIIFTADQAGNDAAAEFTRDQTGYLLFADRGLVAALPGQVFQVNVGAVVPLRNYDSDYMRIRIDFGIQDYADITIPVLS